MKHEKGKGKGCIWAYNQQADQGSRNHCGFIMYPLYCVTSVHTPGPMRGRFAHLTHGCCCYFGIGVVNCSHGVNFVHFTHISILLIEEGYYILYRDAFTITEYRTNLAKN